MSTLMSLRLNRDLPARTALPQHFSRKQMRCRLRMAASLTRPTSTEAGLSPPQRVRRPDETVAKPRQKAVFLLGLRSSPGIRASLRGRHEPDINRCPVPARANPRLSVRDWEQDRQSQPCIQVLAEARPIPAAIAPSAISTGWQSDATLCALRRARPVGLDLAGRVRLPKYNRF